MKMPIKAKKNTFVLLKSLFVLVLLSACSDDKSKDNKISFDHPHGSEISSLKKHTFEHKFAEQCVERELRNSINQKEDRKRFTKPCLCIATRMMRNLTDVEAEKFLVEKKNTHSLKMSFDEAAYFCLQNQVKPKSPVLFRSKEK